MRIGIASAGKDIIGIATSYFLSAYTRGTGKTIFFDDERPASFFKTEAFFEMEDLLNNPPTSPRKNKTCSGGHRYNKITEKKSENYFITKWVCSCGKEL